MKNFTLNSLFVIVLIAVGIFSISCSSDDADDDDMNNGSLLEADPSLTINVNGIDYTAVFNSSSDFLGTAVGGITSLFTTINTADGTTLSLIVAFEGQGTGEYVLTSGTNETEDTPPGMTLGIVNFPNNVNLVLSANNMTVNVTSYSTQNTLASSGGTFSGTMTDEENVSYNVSGTFQTGFTFN